MAKYTEAEWNGVTDPKLTPLAKLRAAREAGEITTDADPDVLGRFVLDAWAGALLRAEVVKNDQPVEDFFTMVFGQLLR